MIAVRILYNLAFPFVLLALLPSFLFRMLKRGKYRHKFGQRFGIYSLRVRRKLSRGGWTWVHAVSVGEVLIALKLIRELRSRDPQLPVVLSTTTSTGYALASKETGSIWKPFTIHSIFFGRLGALSSHPSAQANPRGGGGVAKPHRRGQARGATWLS